jgi:antitoxin component YwqK of YwqJK toxin-antitoxin module
VYRRDRVFHDNGKLHYDNAYVDGRLDGVVVYRDVNGAPEWERTFAKGKQVGRDRQFYPSGKLKQEARYADGKLDGVMKNFSESGAVTYCVSWEAGTQVDGGCN